MTIAPNIPLMTNLSEAHLVEIALAQDKNTQLSSNGSLVVKTGTFTGRASEDKYVVEEEYSKKVIDWDNHIHKMSPEIFYKIKDEMISRFNEKLAPLFVTTRSVGADSEFRMGVKLITPSASHSLFSKIIFRDPHESCPLGTFTIYHDPYFNVTNTQYALRSPTVIAINFLSKEIIIAGTGYAGEIKKSIFSIMNTLLPEKGVLPMHSGANLDKEGRSSVFFGLSGTGKTTLSTDINVDIIGDDEHGLSHKGVFNIEGGCYAKTDGLKKETEPEIFKLSNHFKTLLENVKLDPVTRDPLFHDKSITENGRATYSLRSLEHISEDSQGPIPTNIFFLSADALGVLPAVSKLTAEQAMYYFLTGYSAKLAGTELGLVGVKETFSHCFGAPFMMRKPKDYGNLLKDFLTKHPIDVWLINTGWFGGNAAVSKRYPLSFTRECIRSIQAGEGKDANFTLDEIFNLKIPTALGKVDSTFLNPRKLWSDESQYLKEAVNLKNKFDANFLTKN